jgi:hypothetical protein
VFGLAPIPLLVLLGSCISNKGAVEFFQCHRDRDERWTWHEAGEPAAYVARRLRTGSNLEKVAVLLSLSGTIGSSSLPAKIDGDFSVYEITLLNQTPHTGFLRQRADLEEFRSLYRGFLAQLRRDHPALSELHFFPAVPSPIAIVCGFDLLPKVDPALVIYDNVKKEGGFVYRLKVNDHERK